MLRVSYLNFKKIYLASILSTLVIPNSRYFRFYKTPHIFRIIGKITSMYLL
ncbi:hypothetical protein LBBP_02219 [Leptospira borgpetersenii serovar Ballum]|uniref:Uncharacterized protein n=1 Tax=Leptospira borgpetersenii serovar Ballum TaxID=280505 RepID=A0A0S2IS56_LEPBO|nr:hypothetical protein LBBP_02219 [Leptospira borgpetersenii serovar Ballum]